MKICFQCKWKAKLLTSYFWAANLKLWFSKTVNHFSIILIPSIYGTAIIVKHFSYSLKNEFNTSKLKSAVNTYKVIFISFFFCFVSFLETCFESVCLLQLVSLIFCGFVRLTTFFKADFPEIVNLWYNSFHFFGCKAPTKWISYTIQNEQSTACVVVISVSL